MIYFWLARLTASHAVHCYVQWNRHTLVHQNEQKVLSPALFAAHKPHTSALAVSSNIIYASLWNMFQGLRHRRNINNIEFLVNCYESSGTDGARDWRASPVEMDVFVMFKESFLGQNISCKDCLVSWKSRSGNNLCCLFQNLIRNAQLHDTLMNWHLSPTIQNNALLVFHKDFKVA